MKEEMIGKKVARLQILSYEYDKPNKRSYFSVVCDCGNTRRVRAENIITGVTKSCGCYRREQHAKAITTCDGHARVGHRSKEYNAWRQMLNRCKPTAKYRKDYYDRGITVHESFYTFNSFLACVGPCPSPSHSLDRIDNDGNYEPGNVRWGTVEQQQNNKRTNHFVTINGVTKTVSQWAKIAGVGPSTIQRRMNSKWHNDSLLIPPNKVLNRMKHVA